MTQYGWEQLLNNSGIPPFSINHGMLIRRRRFAYLSWNMEGCFAGSTINYGSTKTAWKCRENNNCWRCRMFRLGKRKSVVYGKSLFLFNFIILLTDLSRSFEQWPSRVSNKGKPVHAIASVLKILCCDAKVYRHVTLPNRVLCVSKNKTTIPSGQSEQSIREGFDNSNSFYSSPVFKPGSTTMIPNYKSFDIWINDKLKRQRFGLNER